MDYPQNCFDKIFNLIKNINNENYEEEIKFIKILFLFLMMTKLLKHYIYVIKILS